jgi:branched-chain amino acid transport system ATP-binding protein
MAAGARGKRQSGSLDPMALLQVKNVSKHFGSLVAVNGVSMTVEPGELRAVIGPNGAGKTTFFNLISGLLRPSAGSVIFDGEDITDLLPARRVWRGIARTFQITEVFPELTVRENLRIAVEVASGYRLLVWQSRDADGEVKARVAHLLEISGLVEKADRLVGELAHGDQRATEIMMALALKPRLLLLDEPTAGMGDQETYDITQLIMKLHREQKLTIVLIEHDMRVVFHLADRIMVLDQGGFLADGTPQDIAANEAVQAAYLGKVAAAFTLITAKATSCMAWGLRCARARLSRCSAVTAPAKPRRCGVSWG